MPSSTNIQAPTLIDLQPNRQFIDPEFDGYKLTLDAIRTIRKELDKPVDKILLNSSNQYGFLHVKLTGLHNHLVGEAIDDNDYVYVVDRCGTIKKITVDCNSEEEIIIEDVLNIHRNETDVKNQNYNVCLKFVTKSLAIFSDGIGKLYILNTGDRKQSNVWINLFSVNILNNCNGFIVQDAKFNISDSGSEIHCLLQNIQQKADGTKFCTILYWVTLKEITVNNWEAVTIKDIDGDGMLYYAYLENSCKSLYIVSDGNYQFRNSTIIKDNLERSKYCWSQDENEISIKCKLPVGINMDRLEVNTTSTEISVKMDDEIVLKGKLSYTIEESLTTWASEDEFLEIKIVKKDNPNSWTHLIPGDNTGEYIVNPAAAAEVHKKLAHLCSEQESGAALGTTFNSEEVEECDFEQDKYTTFIRLSKVTGEITHKVNVNTHTLLFAVEKEPYCAPALVLRHDVDAYVWQPINENDHFKFVHEGTLNAFGYVQASKQQRKFSVCAPDLSYCAICESSRHLFIYKQKQRVNSGELLRNRSNGRRVRHVAHQQVVNLPAEEILGIYAATSKLFLLTSDSIYVLML